MKTTTDTASRNLAKEWRDNASRAIAKLANSLGTGRAIGTSRTVWAGTDRAAKDKTEMLAVTVDRSGHYTLHVIKDGQNVWQHRLSLTSIKAIVYWIDFDSLIHVGSAK